MAKRGKTSVEWFYGFKLHLIINHKGEIAGRTFGVAAECGARFNLIRSLPALEDIHERLPAVIIENLDWAAFVNRYDREGTLFYLDPPYWGVEDYYGKDLFRRDQFAAMANRLAKIKGNFIMSINDTPEIKNLFAAFSIIETDARYSCGSSNNHKAQELIITNKPKTDFKGI